jgi:hypothetical protein
MEKRQRVQTSSYSPNRLQSLLLLGLIACCVTASVAAPARAQYQYVGQSTMMAAGAATGLIRVVPMMATGLVKTLVPHRKNKDKNKNNNNGTNGNAQMSVSGNMAQGQVYSGVNGQPTGNMMPMQANVAPMARSGNMQTQNYPVQNAQTQYNNSPGLNLQNGQNAYGTVQGPTYNAPGQSGYGAQGTSAAYGPNPAQ